MKSRVYDDFFEYTDYEGDNSVVLKTAADEAGLLGESFEAVMFQADIAGYDFSSAAQTTETYMYGDDQETEALGLLVSEGGLAVGLQYFKAGWGILGIDTEVGSTSTQWNVIECSACPESAGL